MKLIQESLDENNVKDKQGTKSAFIAIIGRPNVGKSSLLNALVGQKVAIVSNKVQTTCTKITGIKTQGTTQFVFLDTPGVHKPRTKLNDYMIEQIRQALIDVDLIIMVAEAYGNHISAEEDKLLKNLRQNKTKKILVLNKLDKLKNKNDILPRIAVFAKEDFDAIIPVSALNKEGLAELWQQLQRYVKQSVHFFPDNMITDQPEKIFVSELIREKLLYNLKAEIPHTIAVVTEHMAERKSRSNLIDIDVTIICEKPRHKAIIIGKNGSMLKKIATEARIELEYFFDCKVNLQCFLKIKEDWRNKQQFFSNIGL
ncbi:MAG: GTPase Era [Oscillospiraceae bacterium]